MLELRPTCEHCDVALPPNSDTAMICSYECTFCSQCVERLGNVCPNCGGGFAPRPVRPTQDWRNGNCLANDPATTTRKHKPVDWAAHDGFNAAIKGVDPHQR